MKTNRLCNFNCISSLVLTNTLMGLCPLVLHLGYQGKSICKLSMTSHVNRIIYLLYIQRRPVAMNLDIKWNAT